MKKRMITLLLSIMLTTANLYPLPVMGAETTSQDELAVQEVSESQEDSLEDDQTQ